MENFKLKKGYSYGTNTGDIYKFVCERFGISPIFSNCFGRQGAPLCSKFDDDNREIWFISNSNLTGTRSQYAKTKIYEYDIIEDVDVHHFKEVPAKERVVFYKNAENKYVFYGLCELSNQTEEYGNQPHREWAKISDVYPMD